MERVIRIEKFHRRTIVLLLAALLQSCVVVPRTIEVYDSQCKIESRQMILEVHQIGMLGHCSNNGCVAALAVIGAVTAASVVVSGSIVVAGNVVYWFEKRGQCVHG
ncbi:MAG: hypothetical protein ACKVQU_28980 [Burkholderiales bacterium]